ncbi:MAG: GAF domain-containing protein [Candidatus Methylomirabilales bacterium]
MRETPIKVLLIEDDSGDARLIREMLASVTTTPIDVNWVDRLVTGLKCLTTDGFDVVVLDLVLPDSQGLTTFIRTRARAPQVPIIVLTDVGDEAVGVKAVREGAQDYLVKGQIDNHLLVRALRYAIERKRMEAELQGYTRDIATKTKYLEALKTLSGTVSGSTDLQQVLNVLAGVTGRLLDVNLTRLWLWNEAAEVLHLAASTGDTSLEEVHRQVLRPGEGMAGLAFKRREALVTDAPATDPRFLNQDWAQEHGICPHVAVPVLVGQSAVGVLTAVRRAPEPFDSDELTFLGSLTAQAGMAIENTRLLHETQKWLKREQTFIHELKRIESVASQLTSNLDLSQVLHPLVSAVAQACGTHMSAVLIADEEKRKLVPGAAVGLPDEHIQTIGCFLIGPTASRNEVVIVEDTRTDSMTIPYLDLLELYGLRAIWSVPLRDNRGRVLGSLTTCFDKPHQPSQEQIEVVNLYARHAAIALDNAQLFQEIRLHNRSLVALNRVAQTVNRSLNLQEILEASLDAVLQAVEVEAGIIRLWDEREQSLVVAAHRGIRAGYLAGMQHLSMGTGVAGKTFQRREPVIVEDIEQYPHLGDVTEREGVRSLASIPIRSRARVVGVISILNHTPHRFTPTQIDLLTAIGNQLGTAFENARLFEESLRGKDRLATLLEINTKIGATTQIGELLQTITEEAARLLEAAGAGFRLLEGDRLVIRAVSGVARHLMVRPDVRLGESLSGRVAAENRPLCLHDVTAPSPWLEEHKAAALRHGVRSVMLVPVRRGGRVIGVLAIQSKASRHFTQEDVDLAMAFADQAAIAVEKTRLLQESQQRGAQLEALATLSRTVSASLDLLHVLDFVVGATVRLHGVNLARLWLWDEGAGVLHLAASAGDPDLVAYRWPVLRPGEGMAGLAFEQRETVATDAPATDPRFRQKDWAHEKGIRAYAAVPLVVGERAVGALSAARRAPEPFQAEELTLLVSFAAQAAIAIENARLFQQIAKAKQEWDVTFDTIADGIALVDERGTVVRANNAFGTLWEAPLKRLIGTAWHDVAKRLELVAPCPHCLAWQTKQPASAEARVPTSSRILALTAFPIQPWEAIPAELTAGTILVIRDITVERQRERLAMLGHLSAAVAHEINNPLSVILGFSQLLLKRVDPHSETYHDLKLIEKQSRACRQIVDDLRHLARPLPLKRELINLNQLIQETLEPLEHSLASRKVQVSLIPDPHLPSLSADRRLLGQVLLNLITNAADAMPEGGTVTITTQVKQKDVVEVAVTDTGVGVAPEHLRWIFDPFVTTKAAGKGMGLGLSLTARIVEDHGGRIEVESEVGWGSTFRILLPLLETPGSNIETVKP